MMWRAGLVLAAGWVATLVWYFAIAGSGMTWGYAVINLAQAVFFWRQSRERLFPKPLFVLTGLSLALLFLTTVAQLKFWWVAFTLNRLFEAALLYVMGCAIYRIWRRRHDAKGADRTPPNNFERLAA